MTNSSSSVCEVGTICEEPRDDVDGERVGEVVNPRVFSGGGNLTLRDGERNEVDEGEP